MELASTSPNQSYADDGSRLTVELNDSLVLKLFLSIQIQLKIFFDLPSVNTTGKTCFAYSPHFLKKFYAIVTFLLNSNLR